MRKDLGQVMVGMDLGQLQDFSAISVLRLMEITQPVTVDDDPNRRNNAFDVFQEYHLVHLERFQDSYVGALDRLEAVLNHPGIMLDQKETILDASGLGQPVVEMAWNRQIEVVPMCITGGETPRYSEGKYYVPRHELISCVISIFQSERIKIADELELKQLLIDELSSLTVKKRATGAETYETAKSTEHDDMVMSLSMPLWLAQQRNVQQRVTTDARYGADRSRDFGWNDYGLRGGR